MTGAQVLAIQDNAVSPGLLGFVVVAALGVATWLLIRSMTRQMRKIDLPDDPTDGGAAAPSGDQTHGRGQPDEQTPPGERPPGT